MTLPEPASMRQQLEEALRDLDRQTYAFRRQMAEARTQFAEEMARAETEFAAGIEQARADIAKSLKELG